MLVAIVCICVAACVPALAVAAYPGANGRIAYVGGFRSSLNLYTALPDGTGVEKLIEGALDPGWSANGERIAFIHRGSVFTIGANGQHKTQVTHEYKQPDATPGFSPNGHRIVYMRDNLLLTGDPGVPRRRSIYTIRSDGTDRRLVVRSNDAIAPEYSPNGKKIAFFGHPLGRPSGIWTVHPDGTHLNRLTHFSLTSKYYVAYPDWRPDGQRILFLRCNREVSQGICDGDVMVMRPDGSDKRRIIGSYGNFRPVYSPRGGQIALDYVDPSDPPCSDVITVSLADLSGQRVTNFCGPPVTGQAGFPSWQPLSPSN